MLTQLWLGETLFTQYKLKGQKPWFLSLFFTDLLCGIAIVSLPSGVKKKSPTGCEFIYASYTPIAVTIKVADAMGVSTEKLLSMGNGGKSEKIPPFKLHTP